MSEDCKHYYYYFFLEWQSCHYFPEGLQKSHAKVIQRMQSLAVNILFMYKFIIMISIFDYKSIKLLKKN